MYGIYANIWGILMVNVTYIYIAYMDPMGIWWMYLLGGHQTKKLRSLAMQRPTGWSYGRPPF